MKKLLSIALVAAMLFACVPAAIPVSAATSGDYEYSVNYNGTTATVTKYKGTQAEVVIPSVIDGYTITSIGEDAFYVCTSLTSVSIPEGVTSIGEYAFYKCTSLASVTIPEGVTSIGNDAFYGCTSLTSLTIPEGVTSIGYYAFVECTSLTSVTIPSSVTSIGECAFSGCTSLASVTIPDSVTSIGDDAFSGTAYVSNEANWENDVLFIDNHLIKAKSYISDSYNIPEGTKTISGGAFFDCTSLTSVSIPEGVTSIGEYAFYKCTSLASVTIPEGVTSIGNDAFYGCTSLTSVTIPSSVTSIGNGAFWCCTSLVSITIPESVTSIGYRAFANCTSLTSVTIPDSVTSIESYAFSDCTSLTSVTISEGVTSIGEDAFSYCTNLASLTIPPSVKSIGYCAFYGCDNLVIYGYSGTKAETYAFNNGITFIPFTDLIDSENNVAVSGVVPAETQLIVDIISATDTRVTYDITLLQNGEEIQPEAAVTVKIPVPAGMDGADCRVYREEASGSYTDMNAVYQDGFMVFTTEHFSKYVITSEMLGVVIGDVNGDGVVTLKDILIARKYVAGVASLTDEEIYRGDINGDGVITLKDVLTMRKMVAGVL